MKFTISWLKEHLDTEADVHQITEALTDLGLEVEKVVNPKEKLAEFTIGRVLTAEQHPNADRLRICMVETDEGQKQIICGAPKARAGINVVIAKPGSYIPGIDTTIGIGNIRGIESSGMMCSEREMGLSEEHDGIIELPSGEVGESFVEWLSLNDPKKIETVVEIAITPNRPDALGIIGIARDLAAKGLGTLNERVKVTVKGEFRSKIDISIDEDTKEAGCEIFSGRLIQGVKNGPSPDWLQDRLVALGLRPISILVDITNFFTFDSNRPLHVFDADKINGNLRVHRLDKSHEFIGLDEKTYSLSKNMVVISDNKEVLSVAGIMGGLNSGCTEETQNVFLEAAVWDKIQIAKTGRILKINSDARYRNERGIDPEFNNEGLELATKMIIDLCGGKPSDVINVGERVVSKRSYPLDLHKVETLVGMKVSKEKQISILRKLGFRVENGRATPPSWRPDILGEADLVEEIVRVTSLQSLVGMPLRKVALGVPKPILTPLQRSERIARRKIASLGYNECVSYSFIEKYGAIQFGSEDNLILVDNPISIEMGYMRPDLLPSLLNVASRNQARGYLDLKLFEVGTVFHGKDPGQQSIMASGLLIGCSNSRDVHGERRVVDPFDVKADALETLEALGATKQYKIYRDVPKIWHPGRSARVSLGPKNSLAIFGELHPKIIKAYGLKGAVLAFTIFIEKIPFKNKKSTTRQALKMNDLQVVERDFSFVLDERVEASALKIASESVDTKLIESVTVFDEFSGEKAHQQLGVGLKSLAVSVRLQPLEKTLTEKEIDEVSSKIIESVKEKTGGELRA